MGYLVTDEPARRRFEILVDDALAGFTTYEPRGEVLVFTHTEVDPR
ncbi:GNAT family N-acetyltransferase, partial [Micromonospora fluostatini]